MDMLEIRGFQINNFFMSLDYAPKTVWNVMAALHKLFNDAFDQEIIQVVPKFPMTFKKSDLPESERKWADEETQDLIFQCLDPEAFFMIFFSATHGTRPGETRALQHRDIDLKRDIVTIQRAWADNVLRPITKSKRVRHIPLDPLWKELYISRPRNINSEAFVFCDEKGRPAAGTGVGINGMRLSNWRALLRLHFTKGQDIASQAKPCLEASICMLSRNSLDIPTLNRPRLMRT